MTRFKEGRQIEAALRHRNLEELEWAAAYCRSRLSTLTQKMHEKHWRGQLHEIEAMIDQLKAH